MHVDVGIPLAALNLKDFGDFENYHGLKIVRAWRATLTGWGRHRG